MKRIWNRGREIDGIKIFLASILLPLLFGVLQISSAVEALSENELLQIRFDQKLANQVFLDLPFLDENSRPVRLRNYFSDKPVILVLGYYECPMLCTLELNGMVEALEDMKWSIGHEFTVLNVSINPHETPELAAAKKRAYLKRYGRTGAAEGWHFLTGATNSISRLANNVGYRFAYDPSVRQYAHPSGLVILTPEGKVSHYLYGVTFSPREIYASLKEASAKGIGSPVRQLILLCFHYNPASGRYSGIIMVAARILSVLSIIAVCWMILRLARRTSTPCQPLLTPPHNWTELKKVGDGVGNKVEEPS